MGRGFALIRLFCLVAPTRHPWGQRSLSALAALDKTGLGVRAVPIGGHVLQFHQPGYERWQPYDHLFVTTTGDRYVNVICAPPRFPLGARHLLADLAPQEVTAGGEAFAQHATARAGGDDKAEAYEPETALAELVTIRPGVTNVMLTETSPAPTPKEIEAMKRCAAVLVSSERQAHKLRALDTPQVIVNAPGMDNLCRVVRACLEADEDG